MAILTGSAAIIKKLCIFLEYLSMASRPYFPGGGDPSDVLGPRQLRRQPDGKHPRPPGGTAAKIRRTPSEFSGCAYREEDAT
jgi:hypothetical protein